MPALAPQQLRQLIEYLIPAFYLPGAFCVLHDFISNEGEFRLAVSKILKNNHVVRIVYGLMFYSIVRGLNLVSLRRFAYVAVSRASQDAMLFTDNAAQLVRGVARAPNRAIASGTHRLRPPRTG